MSLIDPLRRWLAASLTFGAALFVVAWAAFARIPALAHVQPGPGNALLAAPSVLALAALAGWSAHRLAGLLDGADR